MSNPRRKPTDQSGLINIYQSFLEASLDAAIFHGGMLLLAGSKGAENTWLVDDTRRRFFKVGFESHFVYQIAVFDSLLNSLTSFVLCHRPGSAVGDKDVKVGKLISTPSAQIIAECIDSRVKHLSRENFVFRIKELERILKVDFGIGVAEYNKLKAATGARNKIVHEGSSYEFTLNENMFVILKDGERNRISSKDWAYFQFIAPLALKIFLRVSEVFFSSDTEGFINKQLHITHPDSVLGRASEHSELHKVYDEIISRVEVREREEPENEV
jgi:hypothetical protein